MNRKIHRYEGEKRGAIFFFFLAVGEAGRSYLVGRRSSPWAARGWLPDERTEAGGGAGGGGRRLPTAGGFWLARQFFLAWALAALQMVTSY